MRPIIIIVFFSPSILCVSLFVVHSYPCRNWDRLISITERWAGRTLHASQRKTLLGSIETHSRARQSQINFPRCGQTHSFETKRSPGVGQDLCLLHGRGELWDSPLHTRSLTTEVAEASSQTWEEGKHTRHVTRLP